MERTITENFSAKGRGEIGEEIDQGRSEAKREFLFSFCKMGEIISC